MSSKSSTLAAGVAAKENHSCRFLAKHMMDSYIVTVLLNLLLFING